MKRMSRTLIAVSIAGLLAASFAVPAQTAATQVAPAQAAPAQSASGHSEAVAAQDAPADKSELQTPSNCLQSTGSRIRPVDRKTGKPLCNQGPGRSYARSDIDRTGQTDIADALRHLDPSIY
ncbi:hypothetical protein [Lysobacter sp. TAF61]|uniref:hypothetical protein n=1 Tax=Lysobacter sp. TAF61 TaxID=3233072 RepID=UPI003F9C96F5